jgi:hypothetical protein
MPHFCMQLPDKTYKIIYRVLTVKKKFVLRTTTVFTREPSGTVDFLNRMEKQGKINLDNYDILESTNV